MPKTKPEVLVERDTGMRGYEITIYREDVPVVTVFMGDRGAVAVSAQKVGEAYSVNHQDAQLELGRTYVYGNDAGHA